MVSSHQLVILLIAWPVAARERDSDMHKQLKGLILAQNERWRRGLGMQVVRESPFGGRKAAKGRVTRGYLPSGSG